MMTSPSNSNPNASGAVQQLAARQMQNMNPALQQYKDYQYQPPQQPQPQQPPQQQQQQQPPQQQQQHRVFASNGNNHNHNYNNRNFGNKRDDRGPSDLDNNNLYVKGLWKDCTQIELDDLFKQFGVIMQSRVYGDGVGFVRFEQAPSAKAAIEHMDGAQMDRCQGPLLVKYAFRKQQPNNGRYLRVGDQEKNVYNVEMIMNKNTNNVYLRCLPRGFNEPQLMQLCEQYGELTCTRLRESGVAFVRYRKSEEAQVAIRALNGKRFDGHHETLLAKLANSDPFQPKIGFKERGFEQQQQRGDEAEMSSEMPDSVNTMTPPQSNEQHPHHGGGAASQQQQQPPPQQQQQQSMQGMQGMQDMQNQRSSVPHSHSHAHGNYQPPQQQQPPPPQQQQQQQQHVSHAHAHLQPHAQAHPHPPPAHHVYYGAPPPQQQQQQQPHVAVYDAHGHAYHHQYGGNPYAAHPVQQQPPPAAHMAPPYATHYAPPVHAPQYFNDPMYAQPQPQAVAAAVPSQPSVQTVAMADPNLYAPQQQQVQVQVQPGQPLPGQPMSVPTAYAPYYSAYSAYTPYYAQPPPPQQAPPQQQQQQPPAPQYAVNATATATAATPGQSNPAVVAIASPSKSIIATPHATTPSAVPTTTTATATTATATAATNVDTPTTVTGAQTAAPPTTEELKPPGTLTPALSQISATDASKPSTVPLIFAQPFIPIVRMAGDTGSELSFQHAGSEMSSLAGHVMSALIAGTGTDSDFGGAGAGVLTTTAVSKVAGKNMILPVTPTSQQQSSTWPYVQPTVIAGDTATTAASIGGIQDAVKQLNIVEEKIVANAPQQPQPTTTTTTNAAGHDRMDKATSPNPHHVSIELANRLHAVISQWYPKKAGKLTGMFLHTHDEEKVAKYLGRPERLKKKIDTFVNLLSNQIGNGKNGQHEENQ